MSLETQEKTYTLTETQIKDLVQEAINAFMDNVYKGVGKTLVEKVILVSITALLTWYFTTKGIDVGVIHK